MPVVTVGSVVLSCAGGGGAMRSGSRNDGSVRQVAPESCVNQTRQLPQAMRLVAPAGATAATSTASTPV